MSWSRGKKIKDHLLNPRECPRCGQWMNKELLEQRHRNRHIKQQSSLKEFFKKKNAAL